MVAGGWGDWRPSFYPSHEMLMVAGGWRPSHETILLIIAGGWGDWRPSHEMVLLMIAGGWGDWKPSHEMVLLMIAGGWGDCGGLPFTTRWPWFFLCGALVTLLELLLCPYIWAEI